LRCHDDIGWGLDYDFLRQFGMEEVPHKKYLNDYFTGKWPGSPARGELYNDDPRLGDARMCGTTASLCGVQSAMESKDESALERALGLDVALHALMFTLSGVPVLYSGDEIAMRNDEGYHADPLKAQDSRYLHRGDMDWEAAQRRGDLRTPEGKVFAAIRRMEALRAEHAAFDASASVRLIPGCSDSVLAIERTQGKETILAFFNFSDSAQPLPIQEPDRYTNLWTGKKASADGVTLPPLDFLWLAE